MPRQCVCQLRLPFTTCALPSTFGVIRLIRSSRPTACASPRVRRVVPCEPVRTPLGEREPASIQTKFSPRFRSCSSARLAPARPMATTQTTAPMPIMMAMAASTLRSLLRERARTASRTNSSADTRHIIVQTPNNLADFSPTRILSCPTRSKAAGRRRDAGGGRRVRRAGHSRVLISLTSIGGGWGCALRRRGSGREYRRRMFHVELAKSFKKVPGDVLIELRERLREIGKTLGTLPVGSNLWSSLEASGMILDLEGWRFEYRVDVKARLIMVDAAVFRGK